MADGIDRDRAGLPREAAMDARRLLLIGTAADLRRWLGRLDRQDIGQAAAVHIQMAIDLIEDERLAMPIRHDCENDR